MNGIYQIRVSRSLIHKHHVERVGVPMVDMFIAEIWTCAIRHNALMEEGKRVHDYYIDFGEYLVWCSGR